MRIEVHRVAEMPSDLYRKCDRANFRDNGTMRGQLREERRRPDGGALAFCAMQGDELMGWLLLFRIRSWNRSSTGWWVYTYVKCKHRRKGIGTALIARAREHMGRKWFKNVKHDNHDNQSGAFYKSVGM